jgi:VanZ family protein
MAVIFSASADAGSAQHTSRFLAPVLHWLFPHLSAQAIGELIFVVRKIAHLTEYGILGLLVWRALRNLVHGDPRPWSWRDAGLALGLATLFAASDEVHQLFVPSRQGSVQDVVIDACGAAGGLLLLWLFRRLRKRP